MKVLNKLALYLAFALAVDIGFGAEISADEARIAAEAWLGRSQPVGGKPSGVRTLTDCASGASVHVVDLVGGGYVVLAANDLRGPVMAFAAKGTFKNDPVNPFWQIIMGDARIGDEELKASETGAYRSKAQRAWDDLLGRRGSPSVLKAVSLPANSAVGRRPFVKTRWGQATHDGMDSGLPCYNYYVPTDAQTGARGPCGCVATAAAQLMHHHRYPERAAVKSFEVRLYGTPTKLATSGESYRWEDMVDDPALDCSSDARTAIGRLTMDVGIACGANFYETSTTANTAALGDRLRDTFGYRSGRWFDYGSAEAFRRNLVPNLDAGFPVVMSISGSPGGHAVLVDGYAWDASKTTFYVSVNMGWNGQSTGWYVPPTFEYEDAGGWVRTFSTVDGFVGNIMPSATGQIVSGRVTGADGRPASGVSVALKKGSSIRQTKTTDANGVYWFVAESGSYAVEATAGSARGSASVSLSTTANAMADIRLAGLADSVGTPTISVSGNEVTLTCATPGAAVRYTTDGTEPDAESALYGAPFAVGSVTVRARAFKSGLQASATASRTLSLPQPDAFAAAWRVRSAKGSLLLNNVGATVERSDGEPIHSPNRYLGGASVWVGFTAPTSGTYAFRSTGTHRDGYGLNTQLAVYSGSRLRELTRLDADDADGWSGVTSEVVFAALAGTTYWVAIDTYDGGGSPDTNCGDILLEWDSCDIVRPKVDWLDVPSASIRQTVVIASSSAWKVVDRSDWIKVTTGSGTDGQSLVFAADANTTNEKRVGAILVKAGTSRAVTITVAQVPPNWCVTKAEAEAAARASGRRIILVYGRDGCYNTSWTRSCLSADSKIKPLVDAGYVCWYCNCDGNAAGEAGVYKQGLGLYTLPMVCVIDPEDMSTYLHRTTDRLSADEIRSYVVKYMPADLPWRITFAANGGSGAMPDLYIGKGRVGALPRCAFANSGKTFMGWAGSNGRFYDDGVLVFNEAGGDEPLALTAIWK